MECLKEVFPAILYILLIVLLVCFIILIIKMIKTLAKVDRVVENVNIKVNKLNGVFNMIDSTADTVSLVGDKVINFLSSSISNVFKRKGKKGEDDYE